MYFITELSLQWNCFTVVSWWKWTAWLCTGTVVWIRTPIVQSWPQSSVWRTTLLLQHTSQTTIIVIVCFVWFARCSGACHTHVQLCMHIHTHTMAIFQVNLDLPVAPSSIFLLHLSLNCACLWDFFSRQWWKYAVIAIAGVLVDLLVYLFIWVCAG